jgi:hypothetical protein
MKGRYRCVGESTKQEEIKMAVIGQIFRAARAVTREIVFRRKKPEGQKQMLIDKKLTVGQIVSLALTGPDDMKLLAGDILFNNPNLHSRAVVRLVELALQRSPSAGMADIANMLFRLHALPSTDPALKDKIIRACSIIDKIEDTYDE